MNNNLPKILKTHNEELGLEKKGVKVWIRKDGIWQIQIDKEWNEESLDSLIEVYKKTTQEQTIKPKILVNITYAARIPSSSFRKKASVFAREAARIFSFEKVALYGGGNIRKIIVSFITRAAGLKNIKFFSTEKEALKWLKEE